MNHMNKKKLTGMIVVLSCICVLAAVAIVLIFRPSAGAQASVPMAYFYDMSTKRIFVAASDQVATIGSPSGNMHEGRPAGARAYLFTCGECGDYDGMTASEVASAGGFIGYLEVYPEQALQNLSASAKPSPVLREIQLRQAGGRLVRRVDDAKWVAADSLAGREIQDVAGKCGSSRTKPCRP